jgi:hypothetical protein
MVAVVDPEVVGRAAAVLQQGGESVVEIGRLVRRRGDAVTFDGRLELGG